MAPQATDHGSAPSRVRLLCKVEAIGVEHCNAATPLSNPDVQIASARFIFGIVSLAARAGPWQPSRHDDLIKPVSRLPLPARGHRACRLALSLPSSPQCQPVSHGSPCRLLHVARCGRSCACSPNPALLVFPIARPLLAT